MSSWGHQSHLFQNLLEDIGNLKSNPSPEHPGLASWATWPWSNDILFLSPRNTRLPQPAPSGKVLTLHCFKVLHRILSTFFSIIHPSTLPSGIFLFYKRPSCYSLRQLNPKFAIWSSLLFLMLSFPNSDSVVWNRLQGGFMLPSWILGGLPFPGLLWDYFSASHK